MNKKDIIRIAAEKSGVTREDTEKVLSVIFETVLESLKKEETVRLLDFGTFSVKKYNVRKRYNILLNKNVVIPERKVVRFKVTKRFRME